jgi:hypothetical protein
VGLKALGRIMRIVIVGKGGSGKTTLAALLVRALSEEGKTVLTIDADINQHLALTLGYPAEIIEAMPDVGNALPRLKRLLAGSNPRIQPETTMVKTTLPGSGSHLVRLRANDPVIDAFALVRDRTFILRMGGFTQQDVGTRCFHAKAGADIAFLRMHCKDDLLGCFSMSPWVRRCERGEQPDIAVLEPANSQVIQIVLNAATSALHAIGKSTGTGAFTSTLRTRLLGPTRPSAKTCLSR